MKLFPALKTIAIILFLSFSIILNAQTDKPLFVPVINCDTATLSGKIERVKTDEQGFKSIHLDFYSVLTGDINNYEIPVRNDGSFLAKIPVESITLAYIISDYYYGLFCLIPGEESVLDIKVVDGETTQIQFKNSINFTSDDAMSINDWPLGLPNIEIEILTPEVFSQRMINGMQVLLKSIDSNVKLTSFAKKMIEDETKFACIFHGLFKYDEYMNSLSSNKFP